MASDNYLLIDMYARSHPFSTLEAAQRAKAIWGGTVYEPLRTVDAAAVDREARLLACLRRLYKAGVEPPLDGAIDWNQAMAEAAAILGESGA